MTVPVPPCDAVVIADAARTTPRLDHQAVTWLLERYGSPQALRKAGHRGLG